MPLGPTRSRKTADESEQPTFGSRQCPIMHFTPAPDTAEPILSEDVQIPHPSAVDPLSQSEDVNHSPEQPESHALARHNEHTHAVSIANDNRKPSDQELHEFNRWKIEQEKLRKQVPKPDNRAPSLTFSHPQSLDMADHHTALDATAAIGDGVSDQTRTLGLLDSCCQPRIERHLREPPPLQKTNKSCRWVPLPNTSDHVMHNQHEGSLDRRLDEPKLSLNSKKKIEKRQFYRSSPEMFFQMLEVDMQQGGLHTQQEFFHHLTLCLSESELVRVGYKMPDISDPDCYTKLKRLLLQLYRKHSVNYTRGFGSVPGLQNLPPDMMYERVLSCHGATQKLVDENPELRNAVRNTFLANLPERLGETLRVCAHTCSLQELVQAASDCDIQQAYTYGAAPSVSASANSVHTSPQDVTLEDKMSKMQQDITNLTALVNAAMQRDSPDRKKRFDQKQDVGQDGLCWYHHTFKEKARKCGAPGKCKYQQPEAFLAAGQQ